jgi:hypothetical protein
MSSVTGRAGVASNSGALAAGANLDLKPWWAPRLSLGAVLALLVTLALATPRVASAPRTAPLASRHSPSRPAATPMPVGLAAAASTSIGIADHSFWPIRRGTSLFAEGGGIDSAFTASGATFRMPRGTAELSLASVGRGHHVAPVAAVVPAGAANQIVYRHGSISAIYDNGPGGVEQAFILRRRPTTGGGALVVALRAAGSLIPQQIGSQILFRTRGGATALRYGQLSAVDATGRRLPAHIQVRDGDVQLLIDDSRARYPLRIDPFIQQGEKLLGGGESGEGEFGASVALSSDGDTALIAAPKDAGGSGAAWVFTRSGATWTQQGEKLAGEDQSGEGVALSANGETALIADGEAASVYTRSGSTWTRQATLGGRVSGTPGTSVALSADGNTAVLGDPTTGLFFAGQGLALVFSRSGSTWTEQAELESPGEHASFGDSVALSSDGNTAVIGDSGDSDAWVFTRSGSNWTQHGEKLTASGESDSFGSSVALSSTGTTAVIGGESDNGNVGAAWVFTRSGSTWTQQGEKLTASGESGAGSFGSSVALSADGRTAVIGGPTDNGRLGAVWAWEFVKPRAQPPISVTSAASSLTHTTATLNGTVNPNSGSVSSCHFEYGTTEAYGLSVSCASLPGSGESPVLVTAPVAGLSPGSSYHFRLVATNSKGTSDGTDQTFTTEPPQAPTVLADHATSLALATLTLNATVNANGQNVSNCQFEYGATASYGSSAPCVKPPGSGESPVAVSAPLKGLSPDTRYHFRILATNATGTSAGVDETVTTASIGSLVQQGEKLTCAGGCGGNGRVALSADGRTMLVGAPEDSWGGSVVVYTRSGATWIEQARLQPLEFNFFLEGAIGVADFGTSVAISADGNTAMIGGPMNDEAYGNVWVFTHSGSTWTEQQEIGSAFSGQVDFGERIALSADGDTALIDTNNRNFPAPEVFVRSGALWTLQSDELTSGEIGGAGSFALSSDGNTALVGGEGGSGRAAVVFTRTGATWTQQGEALTCAGACGGGVALSSDGDTALVGGDVFTRSGTTWSHQGETLTCGASQCGESVALAADGSTALIGAPGSDGGVGAALMFTRSGSTWTQQGTELTASDETGAGRFGEGVALSEDGSTAAVGGPDDDGGVGAAWMFTRVPNPPEFGRCVMLAPEEEGGKPVYHGGFTGATCVHASDRKTGRYEWEPGVAKAPFTTALREGRATLQSAGGTKVICAAESASGAYSATKGVTGVQVQFSGCESGGHKCSTPGLTEGDLETKTLEGALGWEAEAERKVALDLYPVGKTGAFMEYRCAGGAAVTLTGSVLVPVTADRILVTTTLKYAASKGKQKPERLEGEPPDVLTDSLSGEALGLSATSTQVNEEAVEVNTVA